MPGDCFVLLGNALEHSGHQLRRIHTTPAAPGQSQASQRSPETATALQVQLLARRFIPAPASSVTSLAVSACCVHQQLLLHLRYAADRRLQLRQYRSPLAG